MEAPKSGVLYAVGAYLIWGLSPLYWKLLTAIPASQLLAHRIVWCALLLGALLTLQRRWTELTRAVAAPRVALTLGASTLLIAVNWFLYIWAVTHDRVLEASLGYFINPLVTVLLGLLALGERLSRAQKISLAAASVGVTILTVRLGQLPWISLVLAGSFGLYGLLRKTVRAEAEVGLFVETAVLAPWMLVFLLQREVTGAGAFGHAGTGVDLLLMAAGLITAVPLLWFTRGARRLPLATIGLLQYLAPSCQFLLAVFVFREPFSPLHLVAFLFIWTALGVLSWDFKRRWRRG